jgi:hypothetical protein
VRRYYRPASPLRSVSAPCHSASPRYSD